MNRIPAKTLEDLQWSSILQALASRAKTDLGRARCLVRPFLETTEAIRAELERSEELSKLSVEEQLTLPLWGVQDIRKPLERASKGGTLEPAELLSCAAVLHALLRVRDFVESREQRLPRAWSLASRIADLGRVASRIERSFEPSGELSDRASPELYELRERCRGLHRGIKAKLDQLLHDEQFLPLLRENYYTIRNERYVVPVLASARSQVPGIVHNASQSGQTLFVEPQPLITLGNELMIAQSMAAEEERRILKELSGLLGAHAVELEESLEAAAELDAIEAAAKLGLDLDSAPVEVVEPEASFRLQAMRHPLLALQQKQVVPNDLAFSADERVLVVSGPNAGGKTVTLTGVGLCALMLRAGLAIPAERGSTLPFFRDVESAVGDDQDLSRDLSTFSAHLTTLREIGKVAGAGSLVLVDEIAADTDPREGAAIALAVLEDLASKGARVIVTTHLEELKAVAVTNPAYVNARVGFDPARMAPTYRLHYGTPGSSSAIEIARRVGLDPHICDRAEENLKRTSGPLGQALAKLEQAQDEAFRAKLALQEQQKELDRLRTKLEQEREEVRERERAIQAEARVELVQEIERVRAEVSAIVASLQAAPTVRAAVETQSKLAEIAEQERRELDKQKASAETAREERLPEGVAIVPGMRVKLPNLGEAQVLEINGGEALVAAGAMKLRRPLTDLIPLKGAPKAAKGFPGKAKKREEKMRAAEQAAPGEINYGKNKLDVRGLRAEEALREVESFLDHSFSEGKPGALIVHGLGTGALKATIRDYLRASPYIRGFRGGDDHEGGEGVTVVDLGG